VAAIAAGAHASPDYQRKKKVEAVKGLKAQLGEHPDLTTQTRKDGTTYEYTVEKPLSKNEYWSRTRPFGFDYDEIPGRDYVKADDFYEPIPAEDYTVNVIVDPCRGKAHDCCQDVFGTPQYVTANYTRVEGSISSLRVVDEQGEEVDVSQSRLSDQLVYFDPDCGNDVVAGSTGEQRHVVTSIKKGYDGFGNDVYTQCVGQHLAMDLEVSAPACWDHNATVNATLSCTAVGGDTFPSCIAIAYYSSAHIVQCGGVYREDNHCGTFVELHPALSGHYDGGESAALRAKAKGLPACDLACNLAVLSQVRLEGGFVAGYRTATLPLTVQGNASKVVCAGDYELWWVQRTLWGYVTQLKKNFTVVAPACDFDTAYDQQRAFSTAALPEESASTDFYPKH